MLKNKWPIIVVVLGTIFMVISEATKPKPLDLRTTLSESDKIPYGNFLLYELLPAIFPGKEIEISNQSFFDFYLEDSLQQKNYLTLNYRGQSGRDFTEYDIEHMLSYVANGNNVFFCSETFSKELKDTLLFEVDADFNQLILEENFFEAPDSQKIVSASTNKNYYFKYGSIYQYFYAYDTVNTTVLAYATTPANTIKQPILIKTKFGDGNFVLGTTPKIFSNFTMVNNKHSFIAEALSNLPIENTVWDEYYKPYALEEAGTSPLRYILSQKALKWALYIVLISMLIYVLFSGKRLQRIIPVIEAPKNANINFANSLALLYFHKKDHIKIAKKRIEYVVAFIRNKYNITVMEATSKDIERIKNLTGFEIKKIELLFNQIKIVTNKNSITETELVSLNEKIDEFYKNT